MRVALFANAKGSCMRYLYLPNFPRNHRVVYTHLPREEYLRALKGSPFLDFCSAFVSATAYNGVFLMAVIFGLCRFFGVYTVFFSFLNFL